MCFLAAGWWLSAVVVVEDVMNTVSSPPPETPVAITCTMGHSHKDQCNWQWVPLVDGWYILLKRWVFTWWNYCQSCLVCNDIVMAWLFLLWSCTAAMNAYNSWLRPRVTFNFLLLRALVVPVLLPSAFMHFLHKQLVRSIFSICTSVCLPNLCCQYPDCHSHRLDEWNILNLCIRWLISTRCTCRPTRLLPRVKRLPFYWSAGWERSHVIRHVLKIENLSRRKRRSPMWSFCCLDTIRTFIVELYASHE